MTRHVGLRPRRSPDALVLFDLAFLSNLLPAIGPRPFGNGFPKLIARSPFRSRPHAQGRLADLYFFPWHDHLVGDGPEPGRRRTLSTGGPVSPRDRRFADFDIPNQLANATRVCAAQAAIDEGGRLGAGRGSPRSEGRCPAARPYPHAGRTRHWETRDRDRSARLGAGGTQTRCHWRDGLPDGKDRGRFPLHLRTGVRPRCRSRGDEGRSGPKRARAAFAVGRSRLPGGTLA